MLETPQVADDGWTREVATPVVTVHLMHQELTGVTVPVEMTGVHRALLDATFDSEKAIFFLSNVDTINSSDVGTAGRLLTVCGQRFAKRGYSHCGNAWGYPSSGQRAPASS